ncbi:glucosamine-6-phosphate deaminase [Oscillospiraceae bacterium 44-5]|jgi:glucosamine-6-phosphate deaminase|uniref:glucosamine-6-phosphate deaminase n=1 Tax=Lawsonibacter sp. JLR.KK007 TaxID=3114293 RepID=UPI0021710720|nr:glucosamine-6-phosphate deaminase [Lawsonibacter sp.]
MRMFCEKDYEAMSRRAAQVIAAEITHNPACVLGLATGSTPEGAYRYLVDWYQQGLISFQDVLSVNLDEYKGLEPSHDQSYRYFMQSNLFDHVDIVPENTRVPDGLAADPDAECARYDAYIRSLGYASLQLLGIGRNGHIGFNEPGDCFVKETHVVDLTESTIDANARFFASRDDVPKQALSMGIGAIMGAKKVLLCASGEEKAEAIYNSVCGPITPKCPGSILQLHPNVVLVGDEAALSKLIAAGVVK